MFLPCTLERIFVGWGIHMVYIYGAGVIVFAKPPPYGGHVWAGVYIWFMYMEGGVFWVFLPCTIGRAFVGWCIHMVYIYGEWGDWAFSVPTVGRAFVGWCIHMVYIYGE